MVCGLLLTICDIRSITDAKLHTIYCSVRLDWIPHFGSFPDWRGLPCEVLGWFDEKTFVTVLDPDDQDVHLGRDLGA